MTGFNLPGISSNYVAEPQPEINKAS